MTSKFFAGMIFQTFAHAVVVRSDAAIVSLPPNVIAKLLLQPRCGCVERSDPVRLLGMRLGYHAEPISKNPVLCKGQRR